MKYSSHKWETVKGKGEQIVTGPDKLLILVGEMEEITLTEASNHLRVPKNIIEKWCEALELEGELSTEQTFKDTVLMSKDNHKFKKNYKKSFLRQLKGINGNSRTLEMDQILKIQKEIDKKLKGLDKKTEKLKGFAKQKIENIKILRHIEKEKKNITNMNVDMKKYEEKLLNLRQEMQIKADELDFQEKKVKERFNDCLKIAKEFQNNEKMLQIAAKEFNRDNNKLRKEKMLLKQWKIDIKSIFNKVIQREKTVEDREKKIIQDYSKLNSQKKSFAEQNSKLLLRESKLLNQVRELVVKSDELSIKEMELDEKYNDMIQLRSTFLYSWDYEETKDNLLLPA